MPKDVLNRHRVLNTQKQN